MLPLRCQTTAIGAHILSLGGRGEGLHAGATS
jgi:hypothetical protein